MVYQLGELCLQAHSRVIVGIIVFFIVLFFPIEFRISFSTNLDWHETIVKHDIKKFNLQKNELQGSICKNSRDNL